MGLSALQVLLFFIYFKNILLMILTQFEGNPLTCNRIEVMLLLLYFYIKHLSASSTTAAKIGQQ